MVAAIWIGMRIFPLRASPLVLSGGGQYAESHRGIFRLLYSNGIGDITSLQALENLTLLLKKGSIKNFQEFSLFSQSWQIRQKTIFYLEPYSRFEILLTDTNYKVKTKQSIEQKKAGLFFQVAYLWVSCAQLWKNGTKQIPDGFVSFAFPPIKP